MTMAVIFKLFQEEPGGQRALIFDQGNRISQVKHHEQFVACLMLNFADDMLYRTLYLQLSYICRVSAVLMWLISVSRHCMIPLRETKVSM
jgi:hypothetical protein